MSDCGCTNLSCPLAADCRRTKYSPELVPAMAHYQPDASWFCAEFVPLLPCHGMIGVSTCNGCLRRGSGEFRPLMLTGACVHRIGR